MTVLTMEEVDLANQRVLIREDFNVPIDNNKITNDTRLRAALPTIRYALDKKAKIILMSHLGRPKEGQYADEFSLAPIAGYLSQLLNYPVRLAQDWLDGIQQQEGEIILCENVRFNAGEKANDTELSKKMAALCDVFVMDAFGTAHRAQASTEGVARYAPIACAGLLLVKELQALDKALENPIRPFTAIVGGAKVSGKLDLLQSLVQQVDLLIVGGGIANTFLAASGYAIGKSLHEPELIDVAKTILEKAEQQGVNIPLPTDVIVSQQCNANAIPVGKDIFSLDEADLILDIGPQTARYYADLLQEAGTIIWNGPVGVFEIEQFSQGTHIIANAVAMSPAFSIAGGGETLAAIAKFNLTERISYISTGGGAFLTYLQDRSLPAVSVLEK